MAERMMVGREMVELTEQWQVTEVVNEAVQGALKEVLEEVGQLPLAVLPPTTHPASHPDTQAYFDSQARACVLPVPASVNNITPLFC